MAIPCPPVLRANDNFADDAKRMVTLPRFLVTTGWIASGVALGTFVGKKWGAIGYISGFALGTYGAFCLTWLVLVTRNVLLRPFPVCRQGKCRTFREYVWKRGSIYGWEKGGIFRYRCRCGDEYLRVGKRFLQVLDDGATRPYKKYQRGGKWVDDIP